MVAAVGTRIGQARVFALAAYPAVGTRIGQARVAAVAKPAPDTRVSQARIFAVCRGRVSDPKVRAWTFTLDGHDFYVIRLGNDETLLYDLFAEQWYVWGSGDGDLWRAFTGTNWHGANRIASIYGSNVLVGDDGNGALYFLDPTGFYDDDALYGSATPRDFLREITGQVATRSFDSVPCYGVQLIGSIGETTEAALTAVTLFTSDDQGHTYDEHDTITVANAEYDARVEWWSLGSFSAPGRLFRVQDRGALYRIDFLEMIEAPEKK